MKQYYIFMNVCEDIKNKLKTQLEPLHFMLHDVSKKHHDHYHHPHEGPSHLEIMIVSAKFKGLSRLERQRLVYKSLDIFLKGGMIHALSLSTFTPDEYLQLHP